MSKFVKFLIGLVVLVAGGALYLFLMKLEPRDFVRMPEGVLDDAIYAAQQHDLKGFQRTFTTDIRNKIQQMHEYES